PYTPMRRRHESARAASHAPHRTDGARVAAAVLVARGRTTGLERLAAAACAGMLVGVNEAAKEIRRYHVLAALLGLVERAGLVHFEQRIGHLDQLLEGVPCYWLEVRDGAPGEAVDVLRELAGRAPEAAGGASRSARRRAWRSSTTTRTSSRRTSNGRRSRSALSCTRARSRT